VSEAKARLVREVTHLMRLPTGDKLSLQAFYAEAQAVVRRAKDAGVVVPAAATEWVSSAEQRAKDPLLSATHTANLVAALRELEG
jgi:transposase-like protein